LDRALSDVEIGASGSLLKGDDLQLSLPSRHLSVCAGRPRGTREYFHPQRYATTDDALGIYKLSASDYQQSI